MFAKANRVSSYYIAPSGLGAILLKTRMVSPQGFSNVDVINDLGV